MKNIGQKTISTIETKTVGAALHLVLRMVVMARSPFQNFLDYYIGTLCKKQALSSPNIRQFSPAGFVDIAQIHHRGLWL